MKQFIAKVHYSRKKKKIKENVFKEDPNMQPYQNCNSTILFFSPGHDVKKIHKRVKIMSPTSSLSLNWSIGLLDDRSAC